MFDLGLQWYQYGLIALLFVWSGFVRSGLGFGGAVLSLPLMLMVYNQPQFFLPIVAVHLIIFGSATVFQSMYRSRVQGQDSTVNWHYLGIAMAVMIVPKLAGVAGLLLLPAKWMSVVIFCIVGVYSLTYIFNKQFSSNSKIVDTILLMMGAYISGLSLIGAPLIIVVFARYVEQRQLRDTLFVLWVILVAIKMVAFVLAGVDLQLIQHLWLLPAAFIGHVIGLQAHHYLATASSVTFFRVIGIALLVISVIGVYQVFST